MTGSTEYRDHTVHDGIIEALQATTFSRALERIATAFDRALPGRGWAVLAVLSDDCAGLHLHGAREPDRLELEEAFERAALDLAPHQVILSTTASTGGAPPAALDWGRPALPPRQERPIAAAWCGRAENNAAPMADTRRAMLAMQLETFAAAWARIELERGVDPLTGALSRFAFERDLENELARTKRYGMSVSLLMIDIDDFKTVNDTHGHPAGDRTLRALVKRLGASMRTTDRLYRVGGDEFAVILPHIGHHGAMTLRRRIDGDLPWHLEDPPHPLAFSMGSASVEPGSTDMTAADLVKAADEDLYRTKQSCGQT